MKKPRDSLILGRDRGNETQSSPPPPAFSPAKSSKKKEVNLKAKKNTTTEKKEKSNRRKTDIYENEIKEMMKKYLHTLIYT